MTMTSTYRVLRGSGDVRYGSQFEPHTATFRMFLDECWDGQDDETYTLNTANDVAEVLAANVGNYRANIGHELQTRADASSSWVGVLPDTELGRWRVRDITITQVPDKAHSWQVDILSSNMGMLSDNETTPTIFGLPACSVNVVTRTRVVNAWRAGSLTVPGDVLGTQVVAGSSNGLGRIWEVCPDVWSMCHTGQDCGGNPVDINGGNATQFSVNNEQLAIEFITRDGFIDWDDDYTSSYDAALYYLQGSVNKRNAEQLFGYARGYLLLTDVAIQPLHHEFKRVVLTFVYDEWKHANQRPFVTKSGVVAANDSCSGAEIPTGFSQIPNMTAEVVWWIQPYQQLFSFGSTPGTEVFPTGVWDSAWLKILGVRSDATGTAYVQAATEGCD